MCILAIECYYALCYLDNTITARKKWRDYAGLQYSQCISYFINLNHHKLSINVSWFIVTWYKYISLLVIHSQKCIFIVLRPYTQTHSLNLRSLNRCHTSSSRKHISPCLPASNSCNHFSLFYFIIFRVQYKYLRFRKESKIRDSLRTGLQSSADVITRSQRLR